jgi:hypothetical protein
MLFTRSHSHAGAGLLLAFAALVLVGTSARAQDGEGEGACCIQGNCYQGTESRCLAHGGDYFCGTGGPFGQYFCGTLLGGAGSCVTHDVCVTLPPRDGAGNCPPGRVCTVSTCCGLPVCLEPCPNPDGLGGAPPIQDGDEPTALGP